MRWTCCKACAEEKKGIWTHRQPLKSIASHWYHNINKLLYCLLCMVCCCHTIQDIMATSYYEYSIWPSTIRDVSESIVKKKKCHMQQKHYAKHLWLWECNVLEFMAIYNTKIRSDHMTRRNEKRSFTRQYSTCSKNIRSL